MKERWELSPAEDRMAQLREQKPAQEDRVLNIAIDHSNRRDYTALAFRLGDEVQMLYGKIAEDVYAMLRDKITRHKVKVE